MTRRQIKARPSFTARRAKVRLTGGSSAGKEAATVSSAVSLLISSMAARSVPGISLGSNSTTYLERLAMVGWLASFSGSSSKSSSWASVSVLASAATLPNTVSSTAKAESTLISSSSVTLTGSTCFVGAWHKIFSLVSPTCTTSPGFRSFRNPTRSPFTKVPCLLTRSSIQ